MSFSLSGEIRHVHVAQVINSARQYRSNDKMVILGTEHAEFIGQVDQEGAEWGSSLTDKGDRFLECSAPFPFLLSSCHNPCVGGRGYPARVRNFMEGRGGMLKRSGGEGGQVR